MPRFTQNLKLYVKGTQIILIQTNFVLTMDLVISRKTIIMCVCVTCVRILCIATKKKNIST